MAEGVSLVGKAGSMDQRDKRMAEDFMMWVVWRKGKKKRDMRAKHWDGGVRMFVFVPVTERFLKEF